MLALGEAGGNGHGVLAVFADLDRAQVDLARGRIKHPHRRRALGLDERGERQYDQRIRTRALDQHVCGHAKGHGFVGAGQADLDGKGAGRRINTGRDLAHPRRMDFFRAGPQAHGNRLRRAQGGELVLRHVDEHFLFFRTRKAQHRLAGGDHLPRLGHHRRDHAILVGDERGIGGLVTADVVLRLRLVKPGLGGVVGIELGLVLRLADEFFFQQAGVAIEFGIGETGVGLRRRELGLGCIGIELGILRIEPRQRLAFFHARADINETRNDFPADAKAQVRLVAGAHFTGIDILVLSHAQDHFLQQHRADRLGLLFALSACGKNECQQQRRNV